MVVVVRLPIANRWHRSRNQNFVRKREHSALVAPARLSISVRGLAEIGPKSDKN